VAPDADGFAMDAKLVAGRDRLGAERVKSGGEALAVRGVGGGGERLTRELEAKKRDIDLLTGAPESLRHLADDFLLELFLRGVHVVPGAETIEIGTLVAGVA